MDSFFGNYCRITVVYYELKQKKGTSMKKIIKILSFILLQITIIFLTIVITLDSDKKIDQLNFYKMEKEQLEEKIAKQEKKTEELINELNETKRKERRNHNAGRTD